MLHAGVDAKVDADAVVLEIDTVVLNLGKVGANVEVDADVVVLCMGDCCQEAVCHVVPC